MSRRTFGLLLTILSSSIPAQATWVKHHGKVLDAPGGATVAEFTAIGTLMATEGDPITERRLYRDDAGRLLVLRRHYPGATGTASFDSIECLGTGELIRVERERRQKLTLRIGDESVEVQAAEVAPTATRLPRAILERAAALRNGLSPSCREALDCLVEIGATRSLEVYTTSQAIMPFFYPDLELRAPRTDTTVGPMDPVGPFDPTTTPPNEFELPFGRAYFE